MAPLRLPLVPLVVASLAACGSPPAERATPPATRTAEAPRPAAAAAAPEPPRELTSCSLGAVHVVARNRKRPEVVVGANQVAIVHRSLRPVSFEPPQCEPARLVHTSPFPMAEGSFVARETTRACDDATGVAEPMDYASIYSGVGRDGGDVYSVECHADEIIDMGDNVGERVACAVAPAGGAALSPEIRIDSAVTDVDLVRGGFVVDRTGPTTVFAVALSGTESGDGVYALVRRGTDVTATGRLGRTPTGIDLDDPRHFAMTAVATDDGGFVFEQGPRGTDRRVRTTFGPTGSQVGFPAPVTVEPTAAPALDFTSERPEPRGLLGLRIVRGGVAAPIEGMSTTVATFGSSFVEIGARVLVVFSEGTGNTTRIRGALVDPTTATVVGSIVDLSSPGIEAGYATVDSYEGHTVVAWDEKSPSGWEVRAATLDCR